MGILCTIAHFCGHLPITTKGEESRNKREVSEHFARLSTGSVTGFFASRAALKVQKRPYIAAAGLWTAMVEFGANA